VLEELSELLDTELELDELCELVLNELVLTDVSLLVVFVWLDVERLLVDMLLVVIV
jgi:hypothetical protein